MTKINFRRQDPGNYFGHGAGPEGEPGVEFRIWRVGTGRKAYWNLTVKDLTVTAGVAHALGQPVRDEYRGAERMSFLVEVAEAYAERAAAGDWFDIMRHSSEVANKAAHDRLNAELVAMGLEPLRSY